MRVVVLSLILQWAPLNPARAVLARLLPPLASLPSDMFFPVLEDTIMIDFPSSQEAMQEACSPLAVPSAGLSAHALLL
jgi:hypothetical protein